MLGQKMTKAEYMMNKQLLKDVAETKKRGEFGQLHEAMHSTKITNF